MIIPESLKIHAQKIEVCLVPIDQIDREGNGGRAVWEQNIIQLGSDMPEDRTAVSFLHEILHFINTYLEEKECTFISEGLLQVIRDNNIDFRKPRITDLTIEIDTKAAMDLVVAERTRLIQIIQNSAHDKKIRDQLINQILESC